MKHKATAETDPPRAGDNVEPFVGGATRSVGDRLRNAREDLGLELRQVSETLRIRYVHLRALEEGKVADLPGQTYAVGFVRTYADYLGLDSAEMVERYKEEMSGVPRSTQLVFPTPKPEGKIPGGALVLISLLLVGLAYGGWYGFNEYGDDLESLIMREAPPSSGDAAPESVAMEPLPPAAQAPAEPDLAAPSAEESLATQPDAAPEEESAEEPAATANSAPSSAPAAEGGEPASTAPASSASAVPDSAVEPAPEAAEPAPTSAPQSAQAPAAPQSDSASGTEATAPATPAADAPSQPPAAASPTPAAELPASERAREVEAPSASLAEVTEADPAASRGEAQGQAVPDAPAEEAVADVGPQPAAEPVPQAARELAPQTTLAREPAPQTAVAREEEIPVPPIPQVAGAGQGSRSSRVFGTANTDARIVLRATADSWVQVRNARSDLLFTQVLRAGDSYNVPNQPGLTLLTGNAGGLEVLVDGQAAPTLGPSGAVRRDVELDPQRLLRGE